MRDDAVIKVAAVTNFPASGLLMNPYTPPTKSSQPTTQTARRSRERRRNEDGGGEVLVLAAICLAIAIGILGQG